MPPTEERHAPFWRVAAWLVVASAIYCVPLFTNFSNWGREDWDQFTFRYETPRVAILRDHVLPTWNPYANGGTVLLAHPDSPVTSPWYLIVLLLGAPLGLRVQVVIFMALGAIGMARLVRQLGAGTVGMGVAGIAFMMSSHFALHVTEGHLEWCVLGLMPWLATLLLRLENLRRVVLAALLLASVLTFGAVYIPAVYLPFFSVWLLLLAVQRRHPALLFRWAAVVAVAASLSAIKLIPTAKFSSDWRRAVETEQHTPPRVLLAGLFDPRQAFFYQARRNDYLPDGHFAKKVSAAETVPVLEFLEEQQAKEGFHEYGCYIGAIGIPLAAIGVAATLRQLWPLYLTGVVMVGVVLGNSGPIDLWKALRELPLYGQLQVPSRFLAAVLLVLAVAAGLGADACIRRVRKHSVTLSRGAAVVILGVMYGELGMLGWNLLRDVFVMPPIPLETHANFAHRFKERSLYPLVMSSTAHPYLMSNSGTLEGYENLSVRRAGVRSPDDPGYRGEAYLEQPGAARTVSWTMSQVTVSVRSSGLNRLVLNQNFYEGWEARRRTTDGRIETLDAESTANGLVSIPIGPQHAEVEFSYLPDSLMVGFLISGSAFILCLAALRRPSRAQGASQTP